MAIGVTDNIINPLLCLFGMELDVANPLANAWFPLGGHNTTAQSSLTGEQAHHNQVNYGYQLGPESSAAYDRDLRMAAYHRDTQALHARMAQAYAQTRDAVMANLANASLGTAQLNPHLQQHWSGPVTVAPSSLSANSSEEALKRSMDLLWDWLTPEQRKQFAFSNQSWFDAIGGDTKTRYRINKPVRYYNVHEMPPDGDTPVNRLCFLPIRPKSDFAFWNELPVGDIWLAQKLSLELDEKQTLSITNISAYHE